MFKVYMTNVGYGLDEAFNTLDAAKSAGLKHGFEFNVSIMISNRETVVAEYTIFGGWKQLYDSNLLTYLIAAKQYIERQQAQQ